MTYQWQFPNEQTLEEVVWSHLDNLFSLKPLSRQHIIQNQICDLLAVDSRGQLVILELKNGEDRYILPQLTRYYHAVVQEQPFADQVDYRLPIRLMAIAPTFHSHNLIDQTYSRLDFELWTFQVIAEGESLTLELTTGEEQTARIAVPDAICPFMVAIGEEAPPPVPLPAQPPKSLQRLMEVLSPEQRTYLLRLRERILRFDERMIEIGRTTTTQYGLRKGENDIYKTKLCAEVISLYGFPTYPRLMLWLPHPRKRMVERKQYSWVVGFAWVEVWHQTLWEPGSPVSLVFYLGKSRNRGSRQCTLSEYTRLYQQWKGGDRLLQSVEDVVDLALEEWREEIE